MWGRLKHWKCSLFVECANRNPKERQNTHWSYISYAPDSFIIFGRSWRLHLDVNDHRACRSMDVWVRHPRPVGSQHRRKSSQGPRTTIVSEAGRRMSCYFMTPSITRAKSLPDGYLHILKPPPTRWIVEDPRRKHQRMSRRYLKSTKER